MKRQPGWAALCASASLLGGCGELLYAGFENDMPGRAPSGVLPGLPFGDQVIPGPSKSFFVTSEEGLMGRQAYAFVEGYDASASKLKTQFRSAPVTNLSVPTYISWNGKFGNGGALSTVLGFGQQPYVVVKFAGGDIHVNGRSVGAYRPGDNHDVVAMLDPVNRTYRITIHGDMAEKVETMSGEAESQKVIEGGTVATATFAMDGSGREQLVYVIDEVKMSHRSPQ